MKITIKQIIWILGFVFSISSAVAQTQTESAPPAVTAAEIASPPLPLPPPPPASEHLPAAVEALPPPVPHAEKPPGLPTTELNAAHLKKVLAYREQRSEIFYPDHQYEIPDYDKPMPLEDKRQLLAQYCRDYTKFYTQEVARKEGFRDLGVYFTDACSSMQADAERVPSVTGHEEIFAVPNAILLDLLDYRREKLYQSYGKESLLVSEQGQRAYKNSIFGLIGIPLNLHFLITQVLLIFSLILAALAFYKSFFKN